MTLYLTQACQVDFSGTHGGAASSTASPRENLFPPRILSILSPSMPTEAGEYIVGAYLQQFEDCPIVLYNERPPGGGLAGLSELDVVGLNLKSRRAFLCEVTTQLWGMRPQAVAKIEKKHKLQKEYAAKQLEGFDPCFMLWSPKVFHRHVEQLKQITELQLVVNEDFAKCVCKLRNAARSSKRDMGNPFMRMLQIIESCNHYETGKPD